MRFIKIIVISLFAAACSVLEGTAPNPPGFVIGGQPAAQDEKQAVPAPQANPAPTVVQAEKPQPSQHVQQAMTYLQGNQLGLALTEIDQALVTNPKDVQALNVAGLVYEKMGDTQSALTYLSNAVFAAPDDPYSRNNYGTLLCKLGQQTDAIAQFERIAKSPSYDAPDTAYTNAGLCARTIPDLELASKYFNEALQVNPNSPTALYQVAKLSFENGHYTSAREDLQNYLRVAPNTPKTLLLRVQIEHALGNGTARETYADQLTQLFPNSEENRQARMLIATGQLPVVQAPNCKSQAPTLPGAQITEAGGSPATTGDTGKKPRLAARQAKPARMSAAGSPSEPIAASPRMNAGPETPPVSSTASDSNPAPDASTKAPASPGDKTPPIQQATASTPAIPGSANETAQPSGRPNREDWLMKQDPARYVIQLRSDRDEQSIIDFIDKNHLNAEAAYFRFRYKDDTWYSALIGNFDSLEAAQASVAKLSPALTDQTPWARRFGHIQELIRENRRTAATNPKP